MSWGWIIGGIGGIFALICFAQHRAQRGTYRPLASRQPQHRDADDVPLGMEATDMAHVNAATRRNESLERGQTSWTYRGSMKAATYVPPMADDETYAAAYHAAFQKDKTKGQDT
jgi:hypothetical protein